MKIVCAKSVYLGREAFSTVGDTLVLADSAIAPEDVACADALAVRSKTRIDQALLEGSCVRFVGTATAGTDHYEADWLAQQGIVAASAAGCNANSVAEYVMAALLDMVVRDNLDLSQLTLGVIGVGNVGRRVVAKARALGMNVMLNDPPLYDATRDPVYQPIEDILQHANVISLHVPLTRDGNYPTWHLGGCRFFSRVQPGCIFINASRGAVVDGEALLMAMDRGFVGRTILDVWEQEPKIPAELIRQVDIATPHIAGYSLDGKLAGTTMIYQQLCNFFEVEPCWVPAELPMEKSADLTLDARGLRDEEALLGLVKQAYDLLEDDRQVRQTLELSEAQRADQFMSMRMSYPIRREFSAYQVVPHSASATLLEKVRALGFRCEV